MAEYYNVRDPKLLTNITNFPLHLMIKVELLDYLENTVKEIVQELSKDNAGSIEVNFQQGVRRTCSITLININGEFTPSVNNGIWFHTKFKVYVGFGVNEDIYWFSQGIYVLTNPSITNENSNKTITLNGVDKFGVLGAETSFHELNGTYKIPAGTKVKNAVKSLLTLPIGNSAGKLLTCTITGTEYWTGAHSSATGGYFLNQQFGLIPSTIKQITIERGPATDRETFIVPSDYYAYNEGTSSLWFSASSGNQYYIQNDDDITVTAYEGYPVDPKPAIIDNRTIDYYDAIEFLGDDSVTKIDQNTYILRDSDGLFNILPYNDSVPFYKVYINKEEIPYMDTTAARYYSYDASLNKIWFSGAALDSYDSIGIIAYLRGSIGNIKLPYDIEKAPQQFFSDILIEIATVVACDIYYDENGYLNFVKGNEKQDMDNLPTMWFFEDTNSNYLNSSLDMDFTNMFNVIKVVGTNESAKDVCEYTAKNTMVSSPTCIQLLGEKIKYIESSFCYNQPRTVDFANYMLRKYTREQQTLSFQTIPLPFFDVNNVVSITDSYFGFEKARFAIQSFSLPLNTDSPMDIECTNTANIPYFEEQEGG